MKFGVLLLVLVPTIAVSCAAPAESDRGEHEVAIEFLETPEAVQATIKRVTTVDSITELEKVTSNGTTVYDVEFKKGDGTKEITIDASGKIIQGDDDDDDDDDEDDDDDDDDDDD
ncbi:MAG: hypothetical protein O7E54_01335 [Planctomycetota bacterium]|nr:hypothetical protein [Planctomycetota bacterium]